MDRWFSKDEEYRKQAEIEEKEKKQERSKKFSFKIVASIANT